MTGRDSMRGQGALEYLLILAAVLAIAAVVIYVATSFSSSGAKGARNQACENAKEQCRLQKAAIGSGSTDLVTCVTICDTCKKLDEYLSNTTGVPTTVSNDACLSVAPR